MRVAGYEGHFTELGSSFLCIRSNVNYLPDMPFKALWAVTDDVSDFIVVTAEGLTLAIAEEAKL